MCSSCKALGVRIEGHNKGAVPSTHLVLHSEHGAGQRLQQSGEGNRQCASDQCHDDEVLLDPKLESGCIYRKLQKEQGKSDQSSSNGLFVTFLSCGGLPYCIILYYIELYHIKSNYSLSHYILIDYITLYCTRLYYTILLYTIFYYDI